MVLKLNVDYSLFDYCPFHIPYSIFELSRIYIRRAWILFLKELQSVTLRRSYDRTSNYIVRICVGFNLKFVHKNRTKTIPRLNYTWNEKEVCIISIPYYISSFFPVPFGLYSSSCWQFRETGFSYITCNYFLCKITPHIRIRFSPLQISLVHLSYIMRSDMLNSVRQWSQTYD